VGIGFATDRKMVATQLAHALVEHLKTKNNKSANQFMEDVFRSFFVEGQDIERKALLKSWRQLASLDRNNSQNCESRWAAWLLPTNRGQ
jgi:predicted DsbA family dithiol-disulfide isomerase